MKDGPSIALLASLIGDPARANMLTSLMDGRALTASELAQSAGVTPSTASSHLEKLMAQQLLRCQSQGRHRYFSLNGPDIAQVLEGLMGLAQRLGQKPVRTGPRDHALRQSRSCYDHLAGEQAVQIYHSLLLQKLIAGEENPELTPAGTEFFDRLGIDVSQLAELPRPLCRHCLDWSERKHHLAGSLGAALFSEMLRRRWLRREAGRVITVTPQGKTALRQLFPL